MNDLQNDQQQDLHTLGFDHFFSGQIDDDTIVGRVVAEYKGGMQVISNKGIGLAQLSGALKRILRSEQQPGVGDWVVLRTPPNAHEIVSIDEVLDRKTVFIRGAAGHHVKGQVVAANIDVVFIVSGLDCDYNLHRIQRYAARVWASGATPVVVLNKSDLCDNVAVPRLEVETEIKGVDVITTNAAQNDGVVLLANYIKDGITAAFVGSSGTGKSTLINAILGEEKMATGRTRASDGKGRHTTTHRELIVLPQGGMLIDTPGMRELQLFDDEGIDMLFSDIDGLSKKCKFRDCTHANEPGCAVLAAVDSQELPPHRLEHYQKMQDEANSYALRQNDYKRRKKEREFAQMVTDYKRLKKKRK